MQKYKAIGIMSGTSLDGLDIAYCEFIQKNTSWSYRILVAETIAYSSRWKERLQNLPRSTALDYAQTHADYGHLIGREAHKFIQKHSLIVDFISSHGHTIFHQPAAGFTSQIGDGAAIVAETGIDVICDFRTLDVALQGQGAPLVPIGDKQLFPEYDYRLNLGGFANISFEAEGKTLAYDIAPANLGLNYFANRLGLAYDKGGQNAAQGVLSDALLQKLNALPYYQIKGAKSLGREWFETNFLPLVDEQYSTQDILCTLVHHLAFQISQAINENTTSKQKSKILITGGGAYNTYLLEVLRSINNSEFIVPSSLLVDNKEALIFAFLGVLRLEESINVLSEVTGSSKNNIGGAFYKS